MEEDPAPSDRRRRAVPLIAAAIAAMIIASLLYMRPPAPAVGVVPPHAEILSGGYSASYDFLTPLLGWALVLDYGSFSTALESRFWIFKTSDGAAHGALQFTGDANEGNRYLHMFNAREGIAYAGFAYRTVDGGAHWFALNLQGFAPYVTFATPSLGWAMQFASVTPQLLRTTDGGQTWTTIADLPAAAVFEPLGPGQFSTFRPTGVGWLGARLLTTPAVYLTVDFGGSWRQVDVEAPPAQRYLTSVRLTPDDDTLVFVRDEAGHLLEVLLSSDLGHHWRGVAPAAGEVSEADVTFVAGRHWWMLRAGQVYKTDDGGYTWNNLGASGWPAGWTPLTGRAIDAQHVWWATVSQADSTLKGLLMTSDGGSHWRIVNVPRPGG